MNKEILYEILNSESENLTAAEIESIMNEELDKSPDEMDTDLVDLCLDALDNADKAKLNKNTHRIRISKILFAAVIFIMIIGVSIPAFARFFSIDVPTGIVSIYKDYFKINLTKNKNNVILEKLEKEDINDPILPEILLLDDTEIYDYKVLNDSNVKNIRIYFSNNDLVGCATLNKYYKNKSESESENKINSDYDNLKYLNVNNIDIVVFSSNSNSYIVYTLDDIDYNISINSDFETACQIAETI